MVEIHKTPLSYSLLHSTLAAHLLLGALSEMPWPNQQKLVTVAGIGGTFGNSRSVRKSAEMELIDFYSDLVSKQESLGSEFERILFENLWDLYER